MEYALKNGKYYESIVFNKMSGTTFNKTEAIQTEGKSNITLQAVMGGGDFTNYQTISKNNTVTKLDFPKEVQLKLRSNSPFSYFVPNITNTYYNKHKIEDYLYEITYGNIDYDYAYANFEPASAGGCSSIRNGNWFGRNFDWLYNNDVQFIVHTPSSLDHYAVLGVSGIIPGITKSTVDQASITYEGKLMFKLLPFYLLDGINEKGLFCTHNIVPLDNEDDPTVVINPKKEIKEKMCVEMLPRFILDKFSTAEEAIQYIRNYVQILFSDTMISDWGYQSHILIGDKDSTHVIEFKNGEMIITNRNYITNFQTSDVKFDKDKKVLYPPTQYGVLTYGTGLERWNIISDNYKKCNTLIGMRDTLNLLKYSNCYNTPFSWFSELVKADDDDGEPITVDTDPSKCIDAVEDLLDKWENKDRDDPNVWITCHSSIYDINKKILYIRNQESDTEYKFEML